MRSRTLFILFAVGTLFLLQCGKKEKKKEEVVVRPERITVEVEIPEVSWEKSLAVLSLEGKHLSPGDEVISVVMTEQIVSNLSRSKRLKVLFPPSADWLEEGKIEADYLLKGRVDKVDDDIKVTLHLVDAQKDSSLWSGTYEEDFESMLTVAESTSGAVAQTLGLKDEGKRTSVTKPPSSQVLTGYLEGKSHLSKGTREETDLAVRKFKEVLREDSTFALACVGLAESYLQIVHNQWDRNPVWLRLAQEASRKTIQLDPGLAEGHLQLGEIYSAWGDFKQAEREFRKALRINPNLEKAWTGLGKVFVQYGLYKPCLEVYEKALKLNPANASTSLSRAMVLTGLKRYTEAEAEIRRALRFHPDLEYYHSFLALSCYYQGDLSRALEEVQKGIEAEENRPFSHAVLAMIHARQGKLDEALGELELQVKPYVRNDASLATAVAAIYALLKQNGQAIQWLEKALSFGYKEYPWLANDPNFEGLRTDERFQGLMDKMREGWEEKMKRYSFSEPQD